MLQHGVPRDYVTLPQKNELLASQSVNLSLIGLDDTLAKQYRQHSYGHFILQLQPQKEYRDDLGLRQNH